MLLIGPSASALIATTSFVGAAFPVRNQIHDRHARRQHAAILASFPSVLDGPLWPTVDTTVSGPRRPLREDACRLKDVVGAKGGAIKTPCGVGAEYSTRGAGVAHYRN